MGKITIDSRSRTPIFEQLRDTVREMALSGALAPDEQLPSVRALALELAINPNTIQKAYALLEQEGILYSLPARGSFVNPELAAAGNAEKEKQLDAAMACLRRAIALGVTREEIIQRLDHEGGTEHD